MISISVHSSLRKKKLMGMISTFNDARKHKSGLNKLYLFKLILSFFSY